MKLTDKQQRFVTEYLVDQNATQAAIRAGYAKSGARTEGARLLANADIAALVKQKQAVVAEKAEWSAADRLAALKRITDAAEKGDPRVAVSAIAEANKMQGSHAAQKHQHGGTIATVDVAKLKGMTDQELELLERALVQIGIVDGDPAGEGEPEV